MQNLKEMCIYESLHNHVAIPIKQTEFGWICQVFYYNKETNEIYDQGDYEYSNDGICYNDNTKLHNLIKQTATQNLHIKMQKVVKEWKRIYKERNKHE